MRSRGVLSVSICLLEVERFSWREQGRDRDRHRESLPGAVTGGRGWGRVEAPDCQSSGPSLPQPQTNRLLLVLVLV